MLFRSRILAGLGHRVRVTETYDGAPADMMVALHAWRSADSIAQFREQFPDRPLIVALTGTDIYRFQKKPPGRHAPLDGDGGLAGLSARPGGPGHSR